MLTTDQINELHRLYWSERWPIRKIERHLHIGWETIKSYLDMPAQTCAHSATAEAAAFRGTTYTRCARSCTRPARLCGWSPTRVNVSKWTGAISAPWIMTATCASSNALSTLAPKASRLLPAATFTLFKSSAVSAGKSGTIIWLRLSPGMTAGWFGFNHAFSLLPANTTSTRVPAIPPADGRKAKSSAASDLCGTTSGRYASSPACTM